MSRRIEDYAVIGDTHTAALVGLDGSIDWLCCPRFDSAACFAALLGDKNNGRWWFGPTGRVRKAERRYRPDTLILETDLYTDQGAIRLIDFMPIRDECPRIVRIVEGLEGTVEVEMELIIRFDYGSIVPWVQRRGKGLSAIGGPDALFLSHGAKVEGRDLTTVASFEVKKGSSSSFVLSWHPSHRDPPARVDPPRVLAQTERWWRKWTASCTYQGPWAPAVRRSLVTLKALTYHPTGGIAASITTSLPERIGGIRNWDYRFCWLRDATLALSALTLGGFKDEAGAWREWLLRAISGDVSQIQILYGIAGERRTEEQTLPWLKGYEGSVPVRIGNAASSQLQLDVYGEVIDALYHAHKIGIPPDGWSWRLQLELLKYLESIWRQPDCGIWEVRGPKRNFTHSKVMAWVAFDRAVRMIEELHLEGPLDRWKAVRDEIHQMVCREGFDPKRGTFTQYFGGEEVDASLLMIPLVGFLPIDDPRTQGTIRAIEEDLIEDGLVVRYRTHSEGKVDGLPKGEGAFLACSFWLADCYALAGRLDEALALFERLLELCNDVGLLAEEYDVKDRRQLGNFPQAFSHVALINTAYNLTHDHPGILHVRAPAPPTTGAPSKKGPDLPNEAGASTRSNHPILRRFTKPQKAT